ncbi:hypothetical protein R5R35_001001 [Gryllus longicercus]|uniref:RNA-directed DNA polymerase n=1 Tax=Gryllus longicercus TaxID=2509291 RepID=A0AAN9WC10_9ORTH
MREIASRGDIEDDALIQYIIDGIEDDSGTKLLLYGAQNLKEFKEKLRHYKQAAAKIPTKKTFRTNYNENPKNSTGKDVKTSSDSNTKHVNKGTSKRCYNCGEFGHTSNECEHKGKGKKCFNCGGFGHISADCTMERKQNPKKSVTMNANSKETDGYKFKDVKLCNQTVKALIDCGSQLNVIRRNVYDSASAPELKKTDMIISGFGKNFVSPQGYFTTIIEIDEIEFETDVYVVSEDAMKMDMIIGNDLLDQAEVLMNKNGVTVRKSRLEAHLMCIQIVEQPEIKIESTVSKEVKKKVEDMVSNYVPKRKKTTDVKMKISVKDEQPIYSNPRRLSPQEKEIVDKQLSTWIDDGIIEQSSSEYDSQVLVVKKKNGTSRICIDFRKLNRIVVKDRYPLPLIDDILDRLQDARVFCTMDLRNGFFHVDVEEGSRKYTSFITHAGQYQFRKVPFGLCNSPAVFQRFINTAFRPLMAQGVALIYMDDIIIPAEDDEEDLERLRQVLELFQDYGLDINFEKCQFMKRVVQFLGYTIQYGQIQPSLEKTIAVQNFPEPKTKTGLHSFIGLTSYFRKFIPEYALIAKPLSDMLKEDQEFRFEEDQRKAFQKLKDLLASSPVLNIYNPKYETELHTDASKFGYGAVLLQKCPDDGKLHPVSYMSRKTTEQEEKHSSYELEILAVMNALKKFRVYLLGIDFKIVTDCAAFQKTMDKKDISPRVARWAMSLEEYSYTIEHRAGSRMKHADALSRCTTVLFGFADILVTKIKKAQEEDEGTIAIKQILKEKPYDDYEFRDGLLFKFSDGRETLVVPRGMQTEIIKAAHEKGHYSCKRTEEDIKQEFYIPNLTDKVKRVISNSIRCLVVNRKAGKKEGVLHPLFKESLPIHTYHVDHIGPLESTHKGYKHILVVVDSFSKYTWLYPVKTTKSNETIAKLELQKTNFGNPFQIITDRGTSFTSQEFEDYCRSEDIKHVLITTGLPRANGQVERMNSTIANIIAKLSISDPTKWYKVVPDVQRAMNSTYQRSIGRSPFELLVGVKMRNKTDIRVLDLLNEELIAIFEDRRDEFREDAKMQIEKVQNENRASFNRRRTEATRYNEGDLVAIKRTQFGPGLKLKPTNLGPYRITKVKGNDTYDVSREGDCEGPRATTSCAEFMQPWPQDHLSSESDDGQEGRVWESDAEEFLGFPAVSSEEVRATVGNTVMGEQ